jgi:hypothetical protein
MENNVFDSMMAFKSSNKFENYFTSTNACIPCVIEYVHTVGWVASYEDPTNYADEELRGEEEYFDSAKKAIAWLETKVPFEMKLQGEA